MPRASICIPTYNSARFLGATIESALTQDFEDFELVISDNASTDGTPELCARHKDSRIRYVRFDTLVGQGGNWNRCVGLARGEFIALLHADDIYGRDFLSTRIRQFEADEGIGVAFGAVELIDENGARIGEQVFREQDLVAPAPRFYAELLLGCIINPASLLVRRALYERTGPFNEERLWGIDWDMWLRLVAISGVSYTRHISSQYRIHGASGSSTGLLGPRYLDEDFAVLEEALARLASDPALASLRSHRKAALRAYSLRAMNAAGANCEAGRRGSTWNALQEAVRHSPWLLTRPTTWAMAAGRAPYRWLRSARMKEQRASIKRT